MDHTWGKYQKPLDTTLERYTSETLYENPVTLYEKMT